MLFNPMVYQIGGAGTEPTIITKSIETDGTVYIAIPDDAQLVCFAGWYNGNQGGIYRRNGNTFERVYSRTDFTVSLQNNILAITAKGTTATVCVAYL